MEPSRALRRKIFKLAKQHGYCFSIVIPRARYGEGELRHQAWLTYYSIVIRRIAWPRQVARSRVSSKFPNNIVNQIQRHVSLRYSTVYTVERLPHMPRNQLCPTESPPKSIFQGHAHCNARRARQRVEQHGTPLPISSYCTFLLPQSLVFPLRNWRFKTCTNAHVVLCCFRERAVTSGLGPELSSG